MSLSRTKLREICMKLTFQYEFFKKEELKDQVSIFLDQPEEDELIEVDEFTVEDELSGKDKLTEEDKEFIKDRMNDIFSKIPELDEKISAHAKGWKISRMSGTDLAVLRLAVYEMLYDEETPTGAAINEAVELSKLYGSDDSYKFVNGVLGGIAKTLA